jgi:WD40 repeat protein/energy-coupling factor transporter ATP-binding protein EcfA2
VTTVSGGVNIAAQEGNFTIGGDVVGRDKIVGYTAEQVSTLLTQISSTFQSKAFDGRCPYLGLDAFTEDDADRFFGRETLVSELVERVKQSRFVVIAGPSGSGKSSLARAGLIHALKQGVLPNSSRWLYATLTPGRDPLGSLELAMSRMAKSPDAGKYLREHSTESSALHVFAESQLSDRQDQRAVILVDQFEEIFTQVSKEVERAAFLNLLTHAATLENGRVTVLVALRSDFVSNCATYPQLNTLLNQQFMQVGAMQPDELVRAIARPALQVGLRIDPDLVAQIVNDMQDEPGALPLMQFALKDLFDAQQATGGVMALTLNDYLARGGLRRALERHADAAFAKLSESEQALARTIFGSLIEIGRGREDTRRLATFDELVPANVDVARVKTVVQKLENARLITTGEKDNKYTIAHETLIDAWPWLRRLINENREAISLQNQIVEDAQEWDEHRHDPSYLYSGARLATVREELAEQRMVLSEQAQKYVEMSLRQAQRRRFTLTAGIAGIIVALLIAVGVFGTQSSENARLADENAQVARQAQTAEAQAVSDANRRATAEAQAVAEQQVSHSRELAAIALGQIDVDPEQSILIALEANESAITFESEDALRQALLGSPLRAVLRGHRGFVSAQYSSTGKTIVTGGGDGTARVWDAASGQELAILRGHEDVVANVQFSTDGRHVVTASWDGTARVWDAATGAELIILRGHQDRVLDAQFSSDGTRIVTAGKDGTARVWDASTGQELAALLGHKADITSAQFSVDGAHVVTASTDGSARVWEAVTGRQLFIFRGDATWVERAQFSPDGTRIIFVNTESKAYVWDVAAGRETAVLQGHEAEVRDAQFSPDGVRIVTASNDGTARVWDAATGQELAVLRGHTDRIWRAQFSRDGRRIVTSGTDYTARVWDAATGQELIVLRGHEAEVWNAQFAPDGRRIVTASLDGTARVWDTVIGVELAVLPGHRSWPGSAQFSHDGTRIINAGCDESDSQGGCTASSARVWDSATGQELIALRGHEANFASAQLSPDGKTIVTPRYDGTAYVSDTATGAELAVLRGHDDVVKSAVFSPDGARIVTASADSTARVWDATTGQELTVLRGHDDAVKSAVFSSDVARVLTVGSDNTARVWDATTGQERAVLRGQFSNAAFSPDRARILTSGGDGTVRVWDIETGLEVSAISVQGTWIEDAQFSPDGLRIALACYDGTVRIWDAAADQELAALRGHEDLIHTVQFSPDGAQIVTASNDGTARVWDASTGQPLAILRGHENGRWVASAQFSPDGTRIITTGCDERGLIGSCIVGTVRLYLVNVEDLVALAKSRVTRDLTCEERAQYLHEDRICPTPTATP